MQGKITALIYIGQLPILDSEYPCRTQSVSVYFICFLVNAKFGKNLQMDKMNIQLLIKISVKLSIYMKLLVTNRSKSKDLIGQNSRILYRIQET